MAGVNWSNVLKAGATVGNFAGAAIGGGQLLSSIIKKRQANKIKPQEEDPEQRMLLNELNNKRLQIERGAGAQVQMGRDLIGRGQSLAQSNILRAGGGNVGATMTGLSMANRQAGDATNQLLADSQNQAGQYTQMAIQLQDKIQQRKFGVKTAAYLQRLRESAENRKQGLSNVQNALARVSYGTPVSLNPYSIPSSGAVNSQAKLPDYKDIGGVGGIFGKNPYQNNIPYKF
jgi:hypothetical protein